MRTFTPEELNRRQRIRAARFRKRHPKAGTDAYRLRKYGLSSAEFRALLERQEGVCAICRQPEPGHRNGVRKNLAVDHNHRTGEIRGLLCSHCNTAIGSLNEDLGLIQKLIDYLKR